MRQAFGRPIISETETFDCDDSCAPELAGSLAGRVFRFRRTCEAAMSNEQIARQIVAKLLAFRTAAPFGKTWEAFATAEILLALNTASRSPRDHRRPVARREPYERAQ
jgi:hypothetical protein